MNFKKNIWSYWNFHAHNVALTYLGRIRAVKFKTYKINTINLPVWFYRNLLFFCRRSNLRRLRKLEIEGMLSAIFVIKTPRCDYCFVSLMKLTYMTFKWVSLSIFPWTGSNLNLEIKKSLNFNDFLWQTIFEMFQTRTKYTILEWISPSISFSETFANSQPFICNHHQTIKK